MVALKEKSAGIILWAPWMSMKKFHGNLSCVCWDISVWTNWQINVVMPRAEPPSVVKKKTKTHQSVQMDTCSLFLISVCRLGLALTQTNVRDSLVWFMYRKKDRTQKKNHKSVSLGLTNMNTKKKIRSQRWFQRIPKTPGISCRVGPIPWNRTSQCRKKKKTGGNPEKWVQPEVKTRERQLKKHIFREYVGPWVSAMRAKQTRRPGLTTSASVHSQCLLWKPWTLKTQQSAPNEPKTIDRYASLHRKCLKN